MRNSLRITMAQMNSSNGHERNIASLRSLAASCAGAECDLLALPEASGMMNKDKLSALSKTTDEESDPYISACKEAAQFHRIWIHIGSTPVQTNGKLHNRSLLIDDAGQVRARYDKIHLFDVFLEGKPASLESERYASGDEAVVVDTPWGLWGMTICYDLRFPHLYREYAKLGVTVVFAPSAFTVPTGRAHWETLLRCRAIENGSWLVAAAQVGKHDDGRTTYGHSLIVSPWGEIAVDLGGLATGHASTRLDLGRVQSARSQIPSLANEKPYRIVHA